ncbi:aminoglycoside phosphotransferase [Paenibacillus sp. J22TS3]|nr:aminoglycoside phosphotransferase [Paenibacillus sp. J22TS3]
MLIFYLKTDSVCAVIEETCNEVKIYLNRVINLDSLNKSKLTSTELKSIVGQPIKSVTELADGWANTAYCIVLSDGTPLVLKVAPAKDKPLMRCEQNNMRTEVEALRLVAKSANVPVPRVLSYDPSCSLVPCEYFIMEYIQGTPLNKIKASLSEEELAAVQEEIGVYNKRINTIQGETFGLLGRPERGRMTWKEVFHSMIEGVLADGEEIGVVFPESYGEIRRQMLRHFDALDEVKVPYLVHWDLWEGNVFIQDGKVSGIIDFERAFWGDPLIEFFFGRFGASPAFERGYGRSITTEGEQRRRLLYNLYLDLILVIECEFRKYTDQKHIAWTYENFKTGFEQLVTRF